MVDVAHYAGLWRSTLNDRQTPGLAQLGRDLADYAIDHVRPERAAAIGKLLAYAETDTLCYRADPDEPLYRRQQALWEPLVAAFENHHGVRFERVSAAVAA